MEQNPRLVVDLAQSSESLNPSDWIRHAQFFLDAGQQAVPVNIIPALVLHGYAVELALKGFLLSQRMDAAAIRKHNHNLAELLTQCEQRGLQAGLITRKEAESLNELFHAHPNIKGRHRAAIYPVEGRHGVEVEGHFFLSIVALVEACAVEVCGPRDPEAEAAARRQFLELHGREPAPGSIVCRRKAMT